MPARAFLHGFAFLSFQECYEENVILKSLFKSIKVWLSVKMWNLTLAVTVEERKRVAEIRTRALDVIPHWGRFFLRFKKKNRKEAQNTTYFCLFISLQCRTFLLQNVVMMKTFKFVCLFFQICWLLFLFLFRCFSFLSF